MKLFTPGPITMDPETLVEAGKQSQYFRTPEFSKIMLECADMLSKLLEAPIDTRMIFLTASGTAAMEATVMNLFTPKDKVLVISGGTFGKRFKQICDIHHIPIVSIDLDWNVAFKKEMLKQYENAGITGMLVNICETSTAQLYPMDIISDFCVRNNICLVVDAISSFLVEHLSMIQLGAAAVIISSQKGLALNPGMSYIAVTKEAFEKRCLNIHPETLYFRFTDYYPEILNGQTEFTPAIGIINQLHEKLKRLLKEGLQPTIDHVMELAAYFREKINACTQYTIPQYPLSNCVTPVICKRNNAIDIVSFLRDKHDIYVVPAAGELRQSTFRVAHMSRQITKDDIDILIGLLRDY
jgi:aspartate aminotransferase-like enzyme